LIGKNSRVTEEIGSALSSGEGTGIAGMEAGQLLSLPSLNHSAFQYQTQHNRGFPAYAAKGSAKVGASEAVCHSHPLYESEEDEDELLFEEFLGQEGEQGQGQLGIEELLSGMEEAGEITEADAVYNIEAVLTQLAEPATAQTTATTIKTTTTITATATGRKSMFRGVSRTAGGKWGAKYAGKRVPGASSCMTEEEAAHKYDAFLKKHVPRKYLRFRNFCGDCGKFCSPRCSSTMLAPGNLCVCTRGQKQNSQPKKLHCNGKRKSTASSQSLNEPASTHIGSAPKKAKTLAGKTVGVGGAQGCGNTYQQLKQLLLATAAMDPNHAFAMLVMTQKCAK